MGKTKTYASLEEALEDIEYDEQDGKFKKVVLVPDRYTYSQEALNELLSYLYDLFKELGHTRNNYQEHMTIVTDLASNAYRHGIENVSGGSCSVEVYVGKKGLLSGSWQTSGDFLKPEQIALLRTGERVPTTNDGGLGTMFFTEDGDGILILEEESSIYVSKYFSDSQLPSDILCM